MGCISVYGRVYPLTLVLAITNPISDCGCFGDAIKLSNWGTFYKNILFFAAAAFLFFNRRGLKTGHHLFQRRMQSAIILLIIAFLPSIHGIRHQPLIDFRPFHVGANLLEYTSIPEDAPHDVYKTVLYYQKDGSGKEFDETNYPWNDSTWTFVDSKSYLVKMDILRPSATSRYTPRMAKTSPIVYFAQGETCFLLLFQT